MKISHMALFVMTVVTLCSMDVNGEIPYLQVLDSASIIQDSLDTIHEKAFAIGNGDLNALLFSQRDSLKLLVSKNDVWDGRMNTKNDPPLPTVDVKNHLWTGTHGAKASWNDYEYPNQVPCSLNIQSGSVARAVSILKTGSVSVETFTGRTELRTLWQANVFLIRSGGNVFLEEAKQKFLPPVMQGDSDGIAWVKQILPGDEDSAGMQSLAALGRKDDFYAVAVVSSLEAEDMLTHAKEMVVKALDNPIDAVAEHEAAWKGFWSAGGVKLDHSDFQNWWYRQLYYR